MHRFDGRLLADARKDQNLSREEFAVLSERSYPALVAYEDGRKVPPVRVLERMAALLNCHPGEFFSESENEFAEAGAVR